MAGLTPAHLLIILVIALIVIGPGKLPEVGAAIGKSVREFQKATGTAQDAIPGGLTQPPAQAPAPTVLPAQPAQPYYIAQPVFPAPGYPVNAVQPPMPYQPVAGVVEPAPAPNPDV
jgi:sec-independent protein translocase protein TatA